MPSKEKNICSFYSGPLYLCAQARAHRPIPYVFARYRGQAARGAARSTNGGAYNSEKFGLELADFARPLHELQAELVRRDVPEPVTDAAEALRAVVTEQFGRLTEGAVEVDPTLEAWLEKRRNAALIEIADSERKVATHLRKRMSIELGQLARAADGIAPRGAPQERVLNVLPFLARYGPELLHDLRAMLRPGFSDVAPDWSGVRCGPVEGGATRSATVA
jgi:hypothetical protein